MEQLVKKFLDAEICAKSFDADILKSPEIVDWMITVLHSHRHKKKDSYIKSRDFSKIRKVLYSFSTSAKKEFLSDRYYAQVFAYFYAKNGDKFVNDKSKYKPAQYRNDLQVEFDNLYRLATQTLNQG